LTHAAARGPANVVPSSDQALNGLVARVAAGDRVAFADLYDVLSPFVHGIATQVVPDPEEAQQVTHETFVELWRQAPRFRTDTGQVRTWAALVAQRRGRQRTNGQTISAETSEVTVAGPAAEDERPAAEDERPESDRASIAPAELDRRTRKVMRLAFDDGLTPHQIAEFLHLSLATVTARLRLGLAFLVTTTGSADVERAANAVIR